MSVYTSSELGLEYPIYDEDIADEYIAKALRSPACNFGSLLDSSDVFYFKTDPFNNGNFDITAMQNQGDWFINVSYHKKLKLFSYRMEFGIDADVNWNRNRETFELVSKDEFLEELNNFYSQFLPF